MVIILYILIPLTGGKTRGISSKRIKLVIILKINILNQAASLIQNEHFVYDREVKFVSTVQIDFILQRLN
jgi:hypothetical protein